MSTLNRRSAFRIALLSTLLLSAPWFSQAVVAATAAEVAQRNRELDERFAAADKDKNGQLTLAEAKAGMPRVARNFDQIDADKKGYITLDQIKVYAAKSM
jgi:Ca2+-binding EF-hand superfamily protein